MEEKSLVVKKESIFKRIANFFTNIFRKNKIETRDFEEPSLIQLGNPEETNIIKQEQSSFKNEIKYNLDEKEEDKKRFFNLYKNVCSGLVDIKELDIRDVIRINLMLKLEMELQEKIENEENYDDIEELYSN